MLKQLYIKNYALIDDANIQFEQGFSVITGETGAGKSIMLDALGLLLGNRADVRALKDPDQKCVVEATFEISAYGLDSFFKQEDLEYEKETLIRREIGSNGKSRAFVNDSPVLLNVLKELGERLLDIHAQNASLILSKASFYYDLIDGFSGHIAERKAFQEKYFQYRSALKSIEEQEKQLAHFEQQLSFKTFQLQELSEANLQEEEQEELEQELEILGNSDEILSRIAESISGLSEGEQPAISLINIARQQMESLRQRGQSFQDLFDRLNSLSIELDDMIGEMQRLASSVEADPKRLEFVEERLALLYSLQKKHQCRNTAELIEKRNQLSQEVQKIAGGEEALDALKVKLRETQKELELEGLRLSEKRKKAAVKLGKEVLGDLAAMRMENARMEIQVTQAALNQYGTDELSFAFSANRGAKLQALHKVASGGELSRIMLSLKRILAAQKSMPTILFDEIDTGVSGEVASKMASMMREMADQMQVIAITHLPQIAAKGHQHFKVYKTDAKNETQSLISKLSPEDRINEIAQMLSGMKVSEAAVANAKELLS